ncbi:MAG: serine/threonine-protein phosphatase [Ignavibacteriaceae bacterium]|nr:serine/threonine-protein phosphatase [Ignavibacteriaceae bacterium]
MSGINSFKKVYDFYSSGMSYKEIEKLIKRDVPQLYDFFKERMRQPVTRGNSVHDKITFLKDLFKEFLFQLTPIRRLLYSAALLFFILAYFGGSWGYAAFAFLLLNLLIAFELADKITAKNELSVAREIQNSLMPKAPPVVPNFEISCISEAAHVVGGDFYDFINHNSESNKTLLVIGDISGKGMGAAIQMVQVHTILHNIVGCKESPKEILIDLNKHLEKVLQKGSFLTSSIICIQPDGSLIFSRAGHMPLIHYSKENNTCYENIPKGMGIGIGANGLFDRSLDEVIIKPAQGDVILLYTDGVTEARNKFNFEFGENNLKYLLSKNAAKSAKQIQEEILKSLAFFTEYSGYQDDLTLIILKML